MGAEAENDQVISWIGAGCQYRSVAGDVGQFASGTGNNQWQVFGIQVPNGSGGWSNYGWIVLGHIDRFIYTSGTVIAGPTTGHSTVAVAQIAAPGTWPAHLHFETYSNNGYSRPYDWDGPNNDLDSTLSGPCSRTGSSVSTCNTQMLSTDVLGYVGGTRSSYIGDMDTPYYSGF